MMFVIDVQNLFSLGTVCNILIILFVLSNATGSEQGPINTPKISNINKNADSNQMKKIMEGNKNVKNGGVSPSPTTDLEVPDLIRTTHHPKSTLPSTAVTKSPKENIKSDDSEYFNVDNLSEAERTIRANGRFNPTSGAIAAATCLSLAIVGYLGIVLWRNVIHRSYENREILLNEDDIGDINDEDMRHFELKLMDKDGRVIEPSRG